MTFATSTNNAAVSLIVILILALVHLFVRELRRLEVTTRNALLSFGAGASLSYVMLSILPKLADKQEDLMASVEPGVRGFLEHHAYLVAMLGLVAYYGMSRLSAYGAAGLNIHTFEYPYTSPISRDPAFHHGRLRCL